MQEILLVPSFSSFPLLAPSNHSSYYHFDQSLRICCIFNVCLRIYQRQLLLWALKSAFIYLSIYLSIYLPKPSSITNWFPQFNLPHLNKSRSMAGAERGEANLPETSIVIAQYLLQMHLKKRFFIKTRSE